MATGNMHKTLVEFGPVVFGVMRADRETNKHTNKDTDTLFIIILRIPPGSKVISRHVNNNVYLSIASAIRLGVLIFISVCQFAC